MTVLQLFPRVLKHYQKAAVTHYEIATCVKPLNALCISLGIGASLLQRAGEHSAKNEMRIGGWRLSM